MDTKNLRLVNRELRGPATTALFHSLWTAVAFNPVYSVSWRNIQSVEGLSAEVREITLEPYQDEDFVSHRRSTTIKFQIANPLSIDE